VNPLHVYTVCPIVPRREVSFLQKAGTTMVSSNPSPRGPVSGDQVVIADGTFIPELTGPGKGPGRVTPPPMVWGEVPPNCNGYLPPRFSPGISERFRTFPLQHCPPLVVQLGAGPVGRAFLFSISAVVFSLKSKSLPVFLPSTHPVPDFCTCVVT